MSSSQGYVQSRTNKTLRNNRLIWDQSQVVERIAWRFNAI